MLLPGGFWMVTVISCAHFLAHRILNTEGNIWQEGGLPNLSISNFSPSKIFLPGAKRISAFEWGPRGGFGLSNVQAVMQVPQCSVLDLWSWCLLHVLGVLRHVGEGVAGIGANGSESAGDFTGGRDPSGRMSDGSTTVGHS